MSYVQKFYIADPHFGHEAVIGFCGRPFDYVQEMDRFMIDAWNSTVRETDIVYILGDFCLGGAKHARFVFHALRGRKVLILGNHDLGHGGILPHLVELPWDQPPTPVLETTDCGERVYLSHYAHRVWPASNRGGYHFYGHTHGRLDSIGLSRDVGADMPDVAFCPRTFEHLRAALPGLATFATV